MEIFDSVDGYVVKKGNHALICSASRQRLQAVPGHCVQDVLKASCCLGRVHCILGRLKLGTDDSSYLLVVSRSTVVGVHPFERFPIHKVEQVIALPLVRSQNSFQITQQFPSCNSNPSSRHDLISMVENGSNQTLLDQRMAYLAQEPEPATNSSKRLHSENTENFIKSREKMLDHVLRLFNESKSFYFCDLDLTKRLEKLQNKDSGASEDEYFWNRFLLNDLTEQGDREAKLWITPVIHGFVEVQCLQIVDDRNFHQKTASDLAANLELMLISRRSVHRAGTRYIKRGIDSQGYCANHVETEQIISAAGHLLSFVQIRASIPLFWRQPGYKYRPPPVLCQTKQENLAALRLHFESLRSDYAQLAESITVINLIDQTGREKILGDAFIDYILDIDSDSITYVAFDFHDHCRGLRFENIEVLVDSLSVELKSMRFSWLDKNREFICRQNGFFRVNCVDCLDRTNVAQAAFARRVLDTQLRKLGHLSPEEHMPYDIKMKLQSLWANNGDALSKQYAGTAALKSDFTRTGQRNLTDIVKDGYNSASRYYMCHLKDEQRQAAMDVLLGLGTSFDPELLNSAKEAISQEYFILSNEQKNERLRSLLVDCEKLMIPEDSILLACWPLVRATFTEDDLFEPNQLSDELDMVVMLTSDSFYAAEYDQEMDEFVDFKKVALTKIRSIEIGPMLLISNVLKYQKASKLPFIRLVYENDFGEKDFFVWRSAGRRIFNNLILSVATKEQYSEYSGAIFDQFVNALALNGLDSRVMINRFAKLRYQKGRGSPRISKKQAQKAILTSETLHFGAKHSTPSELERENTIENEQAKSTDFTFSDESAEADNQSTYAEKGSDLTAALGAKLPVSPVSVGGKYELRCSHSENALSSFTNLPNIRSDLPVTSSDQSASSAADVQLLFDLPAIEAPSCPVEPSIRLSMSTDALETLDSSEIINKPDARGDTSVGFVHNNRMRYGLSYGCDNGKSRLPDGKRILRSIGRQVKTLGVGSGAKFRQLAKSRLKNIEEAAVGRSKGIVKQRPFQQYNERIKKSRTKFILL